jgi:hypothetical protein
VVVGPYAVETSLVCENAKIEDVFWLGETLGVIFTFSAVVNPNPKLHVLSPSSLVFFSFPFDQNVFAQPPGEVLPFLDSVVSVYTY